MLSLLEAKGLQVDTLIAQLEDTFPPVNPGPGDTISTIMYRSGQRSVIEWIYTQLQD